MAGERVPVRQRRFACPFKVARKAAIRSELETASKPDDFLATYQTRVRIDVSRCVSGPEYRVGELLRRIDVSPGDGAVLTNSPLGYAGVQRVGNIHPRPLIRPRESRSGPRIRAAAATDQGQRAEGKQEERFQGSTLPFARKRMYLKGTAPPSSAQTQLIGPGEPMKLKHDPLINSTLALTKVKPSA